MDKHGGDKYNLDLLRGWQRSQLKLLKEFTIRPLIPQSLISTASGATVGSHELGGKITALTRADLISRAGRDENGQQIWQLNKDIDKIELLKILEEIGI